MPGKEVAGIGKDLVVAPGGNKDPPPISAPPSAVLKRKDAQGRGSMSISQGRTPGLGGTWAKLGGDTGPPGAPHLATPL